MTRTKQRQLLRAVTPGSWIAIGKNGGGSLIATKQNKSKGICRIYVQDNYEPITFKPKVDYQAIANAELIAAAPGLLRKVIRQQNEIRKLKLELIEERNKRRNIFNKR